MSHWARSQIASASSPLVAVMTSKYSAEIERLDSVAGPDGLVAVSFQQIMEELHIELVVLHDHHSLGHPRPSSAEAPPVPMAAIGPLAACPPQAGTIRKNLGPICYGK